MVDSSDILKSGIAGGGGITANSTDTLTNKTIDGDDNTLQDIALSSLKEELIRPNFIINGNMDIAQRGTSFVSPSDGDFTLDRYEWNDTGAGAVTITQDSASVPDGSAYALKVDVTTADDSLAAGDNYELTYKVEGSDSAALKLGTSSAEEITLSFYVRSSVTGTYYVAFKNSAQDRSYPASYTISSADTWEKKTITLTGDTTGTWLDTLATTGLNIQFVIAVGSTFHGTANTWQAGNILAASNQANGMSSTDNTFHITQVKLELGSTATPFQQRPLADELALCERYYEKSFPLATTPAQNLGTGNGESRFNQIAGASSSIGTPSIFFRTRKMSAPTITFYNPAAANAQIRNLSAAADCSATSAVVNGSQISFGLNATSPGGSAATNTLAVHWTAEAEL